MPETVYRLRDLEKVRSKGGVSFTLRVPELVIHQGEFVSLVGPSGCGKSTLLDLLALVLKPTKSASFTIRDLRGGRTREYAVARLSEDEAANLRRKNIGYVLQNGGLLPFLTVRENILLTAEISGARLAARAFDSLVDALGLVDQVNKKPQHLSGGQRQRVAVARALIHRPSIILADEPTAAVDYPTALEIRDELKSLAHTMGSAVVMVTHDHSLVRGVADVEVGFEVTRTTRCESLATAFVRHEPAEEASEQENADKRDVNL